MIVCGVNPVAFALSRDLAVRVFVREGASGRAAETARAATEKGIAVRELPMQEIERIAGSGAHQGIAAEVKPLRECALTEIVAPAGEPSVVLALDCVEDPRNLGAIIRTAVAVGCSGIILPLARTVEITPAVVRASSGLALVAKVARRNLADAFRRLKDDGYWIVGVDASGGDSALAFDFPGRTVLVVGGEGAGIRDLTRKLCDFVVRLPMAAEAESLNASVAAGIVLYLAAGKRLA
jgi:23S rRNA (guanosine2251-2'-O)-methyltransferase